MGIGMPWNKSRNTMKTSVDIVDKYLDPAIFAPPHVAQAIKSRPATRALQGATMHKKAVGSFPEKSLWIYSGCQDNQTSADATIGGSSQGALSWAFNKALQEANF